MFLNPNLQLTSIFILMPLIGFVMTASVCIMDERLQTYMGVFSAAFMTYFIILWIYSIVTGSALSPLLEISLYGRPIELMLYILGGTGMIMGTLAVRYNIYQKLKQAININF